MRVYSYDCTFDYSWDEVSTANWRKYCPWNKSSGHVVSVDTLSRSVDALTGVVSFHPFTSRVASLHILTLHRQAPYRTPHNLHADCTCLGRGLSWWLYYLLRLRNLLCLFCRQKGHHVLYESKLEQHLER